MELAFTVLQMILQRLGIVDKKFVLFGCKIAKNLSPS
jgi:hypothetical protein